ncbi:MAG: dihydroorotase [Defluviitaleaceae bacterium]|nr:dihydroorotase [Defluviitaleaceae bacterium]
MLIKNGHVIDPANGIDAVADIFVKNKKIGGVITKPGNKTGTETEIIDATGMWVVPGLIDMHVHLRDPGQIHKESIETGTRAAAAGGFTTLCCMPNTSPVIDNETIVKYIFSKAAEAGKVRVIPVGSITKGLEGAEISAIKEMKAAGICAISDDGKSVQNPVLFKAAMEQAKSLGLPVLSHCEEEEEMIMRDIILAGEVGAALHICHVSTAGGVELIRAAQKAGQNVTAEVAPHHFTLTQEDIPCNNRNPANTQEGIPCNNRNSENPANFKMSPPLRQAKDRAAIFDALKDGTISVIATDHAPHHADEKNCSFENALNGIIGLETAVPLAITELVKTGILSPSQMIAMFTANPAKILGLRAGSLSVGASADITIIDPEASRVIDKNKFYSMSKNTPFHGRKTTGCVVYTIAEGKIIYAD